MVSKRGTLPWVEQELVRLRYAALQHVVHLPWVTGFAAFACLWPLLQTWASSSLFDLVVCNYSSLEDSGIIALDLWQGSLHWAHSDCCPLPLKYRTCCVQARRPWAQQDLCLVAAGGDTPFSDAGE